MNNVMSLLYEALEKHIMLWNEKGGLAYSLPKDLLFPMLLKENIIKYKKAILELLEYNNINSLEQAQNVSYYRIPEKYYEKTLFSIQKGIFLQETLEYDKNTYTIPLFTKLSNIDIQILQTAIRIFLKKTPSFRMYLTADLGYKFLFPEEIEVPVIEVEESEVESLIKQRSQKVFTQEGGLLCSPEIIIIRDTPDVILNFTHNHMLSDALSVRVIFDDILKNYEALLNHALFEKQEFNYLDHVAYQRFITEAASYKKSIDALAKKLEKSEPLVLPKKKNANLNDMRIGFINFNIPSLILKKLKDLGISTDVSLYSILSGVLYHILSVFSGGQTNFPLALTVSNRPIEMQSVIGPFINTLPLIPEYSQDKTLIEILKDIHTKVLVLNEYHNINLDMLAEKLTPQNVSIHHIMPVLFTLHNFRKVKYSAKSFARTDISLSDAIEKFGISFTASIEEDGDEEGINFLVSFAKEVYQESYISLIVRHYIEALSHVTKESMNQPITSLTIINKEQEKLLLRDFNNTNSEFPQAETIHSLFTQQAIKTPNNIALIYGSHKLTYQELDERSNALARFLTLTYQIKPDQPVCLLLERSENLLVCILGILKAGGAYVPIDPSFPQERIKYIIQDSGAPVVITTKKLSKKLALTFNGIKVAVCEFDDSNIQNLLLEMSGAPIKTEVTSKNLAYIIYTSGTTGKPKGVMVEHQSIVNRIFWMNRRYPISPKDVVLQKTPYVFDVSVWELFWANWYGASIVFATPEGHKDPFYIINLIEKNNISILHFVPSMFSAFNEALISLGSKQKVYLKTVKYIFCSGEELKLEQVKQAYSLLPHSEIHNLYGPTEAAVDVSYYECTPNIKDVFIGRPIDNTKLFVLGKNLSLSPVGAIGEIFISGICLARGYINNLKLTEEKFLQNPFNREYEKKCGEDYARLYRTGDLGRWHENGVIEFLGRRDFQVKIRGYRVELGEIEQAMLDKPKVRQVCVLTHSNPENSHAPQHLIGYYVSDTPIASNEWEQYLNAKLPEYMIPTFFVHLEQLPLTSNGKLDRSKLPNPTLDSKLLEVVEEPRDSTESMLQTLFQEVLGTPVNLIDDFFRLGGDSILSIQLVSRIRQRLGVQVNVKDIFQYRTVQKLYNYMQDAHGLSSANIEGEQGLLTGDVSLLPIQKWFFKQPFNKPSHWNQAFLIQTPSLDIQRLTQSIDRLIQYHDALRLRYANTDDTIPQQYYAAHIPFKNLHTINLSELDSDFSSVLEQLPDRLTQWQDSFNLTSNQPLYSFVYISGYPDGTSRIFIALHHLISDTVSWRILMEDLEAIYHNRFQNTPKGSSYRQWVHAVTAYSEDHPNETQLWEEVMQDYSPPCVSS
jgi:amino acid adenylation domain-containing protein